VNFAIAITKELARNFIIMHRLAVNELIVRNKGSLLGFLWLWINPAIQIVIYAVIFGQIRNNAPVEGVPFFFWIIPGYIIWHYISAVIVPSSRSIIGKMSIVTKMRFPVSVIPGTVVLSELYIHLMLLVTVMIILASAGYGPNIYWLYTLYYMFAAFCLLLALSIFNSALTSMIRDYQHIVYNVMRLLFFATPVIFPISSMSGNRFLDFFLKINPFAYLLEGYRDSFVFSRRTVFLSTHWGWYFWTVTLLIYIVGCMIHYKMRKNLLDYA
jgi:teichoic acid transport system permease protein